MSFIGMWGLHDHTVPPEANKADDRTYIEGRSSEKRGWFYSTADYVTALWGVMLNTEARSSVDLGYRKLSECWQYSNGDGGAEVLGCLF